MIKIAKYPKFIREIEVCHDIETDFVQKNFKEDFYWIVKFGKFFYIYFIFVL